MATITVRRLNPTTWDVIRGGSLNDFVSDVDAVAQILATRIKLLQGELFLNVNDGTPLFQKLLGHGITSRAVALILRQRILSTPYVTGITSIQVTYAIPGRSFAFAASVQTQFGPVVVANLDQQNLSQLQNL